MTGATGWWFGVGFVEPLNPTLGMTTAITHSAIVTAFIRFGVSQVKWRACSQERTPVAPAAAAMAHPAHMSR